MSSRSHENKAWQNSTIPVHSTRHWDIIKESLLAWPAASEVFGACVVSVLCLREASLGIMARLLSSMPFSLPAANETAQKTYGNYLEVAGACPTNQSQWRDLFKELIRFQVTLAPRLAPRQPHPHPTLKAAADCCRNLNPEPGQK